MRIRHRSLAILPVARNDGHGVDLDLVHLRSFAAIVRYGGYHRAAEALHLTQPAVSRHMRRLEEQLGEPLFARRGRGVELTPYGEQAAVELGALQLRVDRSYELVERLGSGGVDAAIVVDPRGTPGAVEIGPVTLRWWAAPALASAPELPRPLPLVAYDPPCGLRDLAMRRLADLGLQPELTAESPHLSGVHAAVRNGLGFALLAAGGDGLRAVAHGPLAEAVPTSLWLLLAPEHRRLAAPMRAALWRAATRRTLAEAA